MLIVFVSFIFTVVVAKVNLEKLGLSKGVDKIREFSKKCAIDKRSY